MKRFALSLAVAVALCPLSSWAQDNGAAAFAERDFAAANQLWQIEAERGSAEAMLGLGLLADRGFGQPRDFDVAFDWYMQAAQKGLAEAQFNVAIMLDAGLGRARDAREAQVWYTRAALRDHARAQYNLGLLFEAGDGIAPDPDLATYWFEKAAASVPAAAQKDANAITSTRRVSAPEVLFEGVERSGIELVWRAAPMANRDHLVEVVNAPDVTENYGEPELSRETTASGFLDPAGLTSQQSIWRVVNIAEDDSDYAASNWSAGAGIVPPLGRITMLYDPEVESMETAAKVLATALRRSGYWVNLSPAQRPELLPFYVSYGYASDQELAQSVASFMPSSEDFTPLKQVLNATQPGEIVVNLSVFQ